MNWLCFISVATLVLAWLAWYTRLRQRRDGPTLVQEWKAWINEPVIIDGIERLPGPPRQLVDSHASSTTRKSARLGEMHQEGAKAGSGQHGATRNCAGCRFWSEMVAQCIGGGPVTALCLAADGRYTGQYTAAFNRCGSWESGHYGAIDGPPDYGAEVRQMYADDDADRGVTQAARTRKGRA